MLGQKWQKNIKFHCHLLQQHARLETRGPSTTLLDTIWPPSGLSAHLPFIIINAKRGTGPLWRDTYWETHSRAGPLRVHSGPLGSTPIGEIDASSPLESIWVPSYRGNGVKVVRNTPLCNVIACNKQDKDFSFINHRLPGLVSSVGKGPLN